MAISAAFPNQAKLDALQLLCPSGNTYKMALYPSSATLSAATATYSATGEVTGAGYTAGGATLTGYAASLDGTTAILDFADPSWANSTITARGAVIYDATNANKVKAVLDFGADVTSTNGTFSVTLPAPAAATAVIKIA
jgi:hypothetical protein